MPNEDFYYKATHNDSAQVWDNFNKQEQYYRESYSYSDEKDAKKTNIASIQNKNENIEDRYFGESNTIYSEDEKYYKGTSFSPSDGSFSNNMYKYNDGPSVINSDNYLYFITAGILGLMLFNKKR